jgi:hypothetical protein
VAVVFPCFSEPLRKDQETYGSDKSTRAEALASLVPFRFYVLMYSEAGDRQRKNPLLLGERSEL